MKTRREAQCRTRILAGLLTMVLVLMMGIMADTFVMISHAQSQGKVTASSAKIRKDPSASSEAVGSAKQDANVTINFQTTASDGTTWYQIFVDADTLGYIRSDLVQITDGTTPATQSVTTGTTTAATTAPTTTTTAVTETPAEVTAVNPVAATVTGGQSVRVRSNASTSSQIVTSVQNGLAVTIAGQATGTDGRVWYQVMFLSNGTEVNGFIRSDYISLSEELTPLTEGGTEGGETTEEPEQVEEPVVSKTYETQEQSGTWYLINNDAGEQYDIAKLFASVETNYQLAMDNQDTVKSQRIAIILLVFVVIALAAATVFLFMKLRDNADAAYFSEVERETLSKRSGGANGSKAVMPTVGTGKGSGTRPAGARPAGTAPQGSRPAGSRPAGAAPQGSRPAGARPAGAAPQGSRPAGSRPVQEAPQGNRQPAARPAQEAPQGNRPAARPAQEAPQGNRPAARPAQEAPQGNRPAGVRPAQTAPQGARPAGNRPTESGRPQTQPNPAWKSKNFMNDDDEFEFEFLNWDGEEES